MSESLAELARKVFSQTVKYTTSISRPKPPVVTPLGNGVLLDINQSFYIISAGHLINATDFPNLMIPAKNDSMTLLNGKMVTTYMSYDEKHKVDLAVFRFSQRQNKHIEGHYTFLKPGQIAINHKTVETSSYIISGFPLNNINKTTGQPIYETSPLNVLTATVKRRTYKKFGFNPDTHILVKLYGRIKPFLSHYKVKIKSPTGISGSGLWYVPNWGRVDKNGVPEHFLVGILTDNYIDQGFVAAVRIDFATEILRINFGILGTSSKLTKFGDHLKEVYVGEIP